MSYLDQDSWIESACLTCAEEVEKHSGEAIEEGNYIIVSCPDELIQEYYDRVYYTNYAIRCPKCYKGETKIYNEDDLREKIYEILGASDIKNIIKILFSPKDNIAIKPAKE